MAGFARCRGKCATFSLRLRRTIARSARLVAAALAFGACASPRGTTAVSPSAPLSPTDVHLWAALLRAADARAVDTAVIQAALSSHRSPLRAAGARAIGQLSARQLAPTLRNLLADADSTVAANAAYALGLLADTGSLAALEHAAHLAPPAATEAAWALGRIGEPARGSIERLLATPGLSPSVAGAAVLAAAKLKPVPVASLRAYLAAPDPQLRWRAAYAIARPYVAAGVRSVLPLPTDTSALVREQVARALSKVAAGDSLQAPSVSALTQLLRDPEAHVRVNAVRALASYGTTGRAAVIAATRDSDANVRIAAAQSLGPVLAQARPLWNAAWDADTGFMYRRSVLVSALSQDVLLKAIDADDPDGWAHQGDWRLRAAVADAGAAAADIQRVREVSLPLARDPDGRVRVAAYGAMAPHADTADAHPWRRAFMMLALTDYDFYVRVTGLDALSGHARASEVPKVIASYVMALRDSVSDARLAAVRCLVAAWRHDSAAFGDSLVRVVSALPPPPDALTRAAGRDLPLLGAWRAVPEAPPHELAWYEKRVRTVIAPALTGAMPRAVIETERGSIILELFAIDAPLTVDNFLTLARAHYFDDVRFHRVVPDFVAQDGDPRGDGNGGPPYTIRDELNRRRYDRGAVGMALSGPDTGGSQYFLTLSAQPHLDGGYTVFARVVDGWAVMDALVQGDRIVGIKPL